MSRAVMSVTLLFAMMAFAVLASAKRLPPPRVGFCVIDPDVDFKRTHRTLWNNFILPIQPAQDLRYVIVEGGDQPKESFGLDASFHADEWHTVVPSCAEEAYKSHSCCAMDGEAMKTMEALRPFTMRLSCYERLLAQEKASGKPFDLIVWIRANALVLEPMLPGSYIVKGTPRVGVLRELEANHCSRITKANQPPIFRNGDEILDTYFAAPRSLTDALVEQFRLVHSRPCFDKDTNRWADTIPRRLGQILRGDLGSKVPWEAHQVMITHLQGTRTNCDLLSYNNFRGKVRSLKDGRLLTGHEWCEENVPPVV